MKLALTTAIALVAVVGSADVQAREQGTHGLDPVTVDRLPEPPLPDALPTAWCGEERAGDDLEHETHPGAAKYHAIYALPSDGTSRLESVASQLQADARQASALLERLYGRAIRFDMGTSCGPEFLDISTVPLTASTAELALLAAQADDSLFSRVLSDLRAAGVPLLPSRVTAAEAERLTKNFLVWLDGPAPELYCGQATVFDDPTRAPSNWNEYGGKLALVFRDGSGFCNSNTVRHEIAHNLGALQPGAPHAIDGAHCDDAYEDTMCLQQAPSRASGEYNALFFDYGNDDYWDPPGGEPLPRWTVNLSRFVCPDAYCNGVAGSSGGSIVDRDGDVLPDALDACPDTPGSDCDPVDDRAQAYPSYVRARVSRRRLSPRRVRMKIRLRGRGQALVRVRCARKVVFRRHVGLPERLRFRVPCRSRPRVKVRTLETDTGAGP